MKYILSVMIAVFMFVSNAKAQGEVANVKTKGRTEFAQVTSVESIIPGGLGRSKILITYPDGKQEEKKIENLYSLVGINFGDIKFNENEILKTLTEFENNGWTLFQVTGLTQSPSEGQSQGIFMTRYLFKREVN